MSLYRIGIVLAVFFLVALGREVTAGGPVPATIDPETIDIAAGPFITGSDRAEREAAYRLDEAAYGHSRTRQWKWYEDEGDRRQVSVDAFAIMRHLVTNAEYAAFIVATGHRAPDVDPRTWASYKLIHPYKRTRRHAWRDGKPPPGRADHPAVMVSHDDATTYAQWLRDVTGLDCRLPSEREWEKAARGTDGRRFPWGEAYDPSRLNSHDQGPFDTVPVDRHPSGASPFGLLDAAGQVFEWTATVGGKDRYVVKGGSWDDRGCGICRPAARHTRPAHIKHILVGFRLVRTE